MTNASFGGQRRVPHAVFCDGRTQWVVGPQTTSSGGSERSVTLMYTSDLELACIRIGLSIPDSTIFVIILITFAFSKLHDRVLVRCAHCGVCVCPPPTATSTQVYAKV